ncbi:MAG: hypothetical protein D5R98_08965 [Desulfonatronovibrio sp. MSAO_Bac4]|nr:MAG: hypothetical protein D5R98_08965 [Desulfonatronovibrio sp. MSAO_Bac4]
MPGCAIALSLVPEIKKTAFQDGLCFQRGNYSARSNKKIWTPDPSSRIRSGTGVTVKAWPLLFSVIPAKAGIQRHLVAVFRMW